MIDIESQILGSMFVSLLSKAVIIDIYIRKIGHKNELLPNTPQINV